jgi:type IV pilus assembly protein PilQ
MKKGFFLFICLFLISSVSWAQEIKNVNFFQEGEVSKLIIETDKPVLAERFHVTEDKQIILDIKNVRVSPKLLRGIDTSEFPGSSVYISGYKKPGSENDIRFAIQLRDNVRSLLDINDNKITLSIENRFGVFSQNKVRETDGGQITAATNQSTDGVGLKIPRSASVEDILENLTLSGPKKYIGKRISINVKDIPIATVLNMIADTSGFNIIIDQEVAKSPNLSLTLTNMPWDQALDTIMNLAKLSAVKSSNILVIKTTAQLNKENKDSLEAKVLKEEVEPMVTRVFLINYADLTSLQNILKDYLTPVPTGQVTGSASSLTNRASIALDERTNSLIVKDTVESIERIRKIVETLDTQTPQIMIEAKIVEASESYSKRLGLSRGVTFGYDPVKSISGLASVGPGFSFSTAPNAQSPGVLGMTIGVYKRLLNLDFNLQLMESESKGRVISTPRVVTQNKKAATLTSTETTSFRVQQLATGTAPAVATFQNVSATLTLGVTPQVTNDGAINMQINISKGSFGSRPTTDAPPNTSTRAVNTNVLVDNGSTVVIGGLYSTSSQENRNGIPILKDLPLIGWLFSSPYAPDTSKAELIVFLTPRILNQDEAGFTERQASKNSLQSNGSGVQ